MPELKAVDNPVDLNQGIDIQIERLEEPTKRPLTKLLSSAIRGVGRLARNLGTEAGTYAGVLGYGTYDLVKNTAKIGFDAIRRSANRIAHPRGGPLYESENQSAEKKTDTESSQKNTDTTSSQANTETELKNVIELRNAAHQPDELKYTQA